MTDNQYSAFNLESLLGSATASPWRVTEKDMSEFTSTLGTSSATAPATTNPMASQPYRPTPTSNTQSPPPPPTNQASSAAPTSAQGIPVPYAPMMPTHFPPPSSLGNLSTQHLLSSQLLSQLSSQIAARFGAGGPAPPAPSGTGVARTSTPPSGSQSDSLAPPQPVRFVSGAFGADLNEPPSFAYWNPNNSSSPPVHDHRLASLDSSPGSALAAAAAAAAAAKPGAAALSAGAAAATRTALDPRKYKTQLCRNWQRTGCCAFGDSCVYAHGREDLRKEGKTAGLEPSGAPQEKIPDLLVTPQRLHIDPTGLPVSVSAMPPANKPTAPTASGLMHYVLDPEAPKSSSDNGSTKAESSTGGGGGKMDSISALAAAMGGMGDGQFGPGARDSETISNGEILAFILTRLQKLERELTLVKQVVECLIIQGENE